MRALFLDRDGVICENREDHVKSWAEFQFIPGALWALRQIAGTDLAVVVVTNQAGINRGHINPETVTDIHMQLMTVVRRVGARIDRILVCPHRPDEACSCRKPRPGMLLQAASEMGIELRQSYVIGDAVTDIQAGLAAGCKCTLVLTGRGMQQVKIAGQDASLKFERAFDLKHAVETILHLESVRVSRPAASRAITRPLSLPTLPGHAS